MRGAIRLGLILATALAMAHGAHVLFKKGPSVAAPATYGHIVFSLTRDEIESMERVAMDLFHRYMFLIEKYGGEQNITKEHQDCETGVRSCDGFEFPHRADVTASHIDAAELRKITKKIVRVSRQTARMAFGSTTTRRRDPRNPLALAIVGIGEVINLGLGVYNTYEIQQLKAQMGTVTQEIDSLVQTNKDIIQTQLRDHGMIERLLNATLS